MKRTKSKALKVTPFTLFMKQRKGQLEREGHTFGGGWKDVAQYISDEWTGMSEHQKNFWREKAELENECKDEKQSHFENGSPENMPENGRKPSYEKVFLNCEVRNVEQTLLSYIGEQDVSTIEFPVLHFNSYGPYYAHIFVPSEYSLGSFAVQNGYIAVQGRIIDPGRLPTDVSRATVHEERDSKGIPAPPYTYSPGPVYTFPYNTQEHFEMILGEIMRYSIVMNDSVTGRPINILFTPYEEHIVKIRGCILWLMMKCGQEFNFEILKMTTLMKVVSNAYTKGDATRVGIWYEEDAARLLNDALLNYTACLACDWHQRPEHSEKVKVCSSNIVSRGIYLALSAFCEIFNLQREIPSHMPDFAAEVNTYDWKNIVERIEFRQRFGLDPVIKEARACLRRQFISPDFLSTLKKKYPLGLMREPNIIIWPKDSDVVKDLNYNKDCPVKISAPKPSDPPSEDEFDW